MQNLRTPPVFPLPEPPGETRVASLIRRPQFLLPVAVVVGMIVLAFGFQAGGSSTKAEGPVITTTAAPSQTAAPSPTKGASTPSATASTKPGSTATSATAEVAAARATGTTTATASAAASTTPDIDLSRESTQCGSIQENAVALGVEQAISGVSVKATRAAVYPAEYFRCMLMATGGNEAINLATSIAKALKDGTTHVVLIDVWVTNSGRDFGQVNLKTATVAAAGQTFSPIATLGGRSEVVISSGQGRTVTLVVPLTNNVGTNTGPMTLGIDAPLIGGKQTAGKYQLFLPTP